MSRLVAHQRIFRLKWKFDAYVLPSGAAAKLCTAEQGKTTITLLPLCSILSWTLTLSLLLAALQ